MSINGGLPKSFNINKENIIIININPAQGVKDERIAAITKKFKNLHQFMIEA